MNDYIDQYELAKQLIKNQWSSYSNSETLERMSKTKNLNEVLFLF